jgi:hypothetical protein
MNIKESEVHIYENGILISKVYQPTQKHARQFIKEQKLILVNDLKMNYQFKIKPFKK